MTIESISRIAELTGKTRRTITKRCSKLDQYEGPKNSTCYESTDALAAIYEVDKERESTLELERTRLTKAQADKTELEVGQLEGDLIHTDAMEKELADIILNARSKLLTLPVRISKVAIAAETIKEIENEVRKIVHQALDDLASGQRHTNKNTAKMGSASRTISQ